MMAKDRFLAKTNLAKIWPNLIWQPLLAVICVCVILYFMSRYSHSNISWAVGASSLASSCFIIFAHPFGKTAAPQKVIGGYVVAIFSGEIINLIASRFHFFHGTIFISPHFHLIGMLAGITVGVVTLFMVLLDFEHPPATGIALVIIIDVRDYDTLIVVFLAAVVLSIIHTALRRWLKDLV